MIHSSSYLLCRLHFRGVHGGLSELVDMSDLPFTSLENLVRRVFVRGGFAVKISEYKLGPCPLGTFVDSSRVDPSCQDCPAGKL